MLTARSTAKDPLPACHKRLVDTQIAWFERNVGVVKLLARASRAIVSLGPPPNLRYFPTPMVVVLTCSFLSQSPKGSYLLKLVSLNKTWPRSNRALLKLVTRLV